MIRDHVTLSGTAGSVMAGWNISFNGAAASPKGLAKTEKSCVRQANDSYP